MTFILPGLYHSLTHTHTRLFVISHYLVSSYKCFQKFRFFRLLCSAGRPIWKKNAEFPLTQPRFHLSALLASMPAAVINWKIAHNRHLMAAGVGLFPTQHAIRLLSDDAIERWFNEQYDFHSRMHNACAGRTDPLIWIGIENMPPGPRRWVHLKWAHFHCNRIPALTWSGANVICHCRAR